MSSLNKIEAKAYQDPESGLIFELYPIDDGGKVMFNLDGSPYKFKNFVLGMSRNENSLQSLFLHVPIMTSEDLIKIGELDYIDLPYPKEEIEALTDVLVRFEMKKEAIDKFLTPKFGSVKDLKQFLDLKDDVGGSVVLDFYYYTIASIENPFQHLIKPPILADD